MLSEETMDVGPFSSSSIFLFQGLGLESLHGNRARFTQCIFFCFSDGNDKSLCINGVVDGEDCLLKLSG